MSTSTPIIRLGAAVAARGVELRAVVPQVQLETATRTISGTITEYETASSTQGVTIHAGALTARQPLDRVKLLRDHDTSDPVGYMTELSADARDATFHVPEGENGDRALSEADNGLRNGLSVGFAVRQYAYDDNFNLHVYEAELYEVSLVAVPDMPDAQVTSVAMSAPNREEPMNEAQLRAALAAGTITQETFDVQLAALRSSTPTPTDPPTPDPTPGTEPPANPPVSLAGGPTPLPPSAPLARTQQRRLSVHDVALRIAAAGADLSGSFGERLQRVSLAIQDILPATDAGHGWIGRADWAGELWTASQYTRPWIDSIGAPAELTSAKRTGFRWKTKPTVDEYSGNKSEVPSSNYETEPDTYDAFRIAGGWDIDRIFEDLPSDPGFIEAFWAAATDMYKVKSDAAIRTRMLALANANDKTSSTTGGNTATVAGTTIIQLLKQIVRDGRNILGSNVNRIWLDNVLFAELEDLPTGGTNGLPLWLAKANIGMNISEGSADVDTLHIMNDPSLTARTAVYYDTRAVKVREKTPFQVRGIDVAHGGIDLALFSYLMLEDQDPRLIMKRVRPAA